MLRRIAPALLILATFILDTTLMPIVYGGVYTVPLTLVAVFLIGMLLGRMSGLLYGTIGGLLIDITSGTLGMMAFFFMAVGFLIGLILYNPGEHLRMARRNARKRRIQRGGKHEHVPVEPQIDIWHVDPFQQYRANDTAPRLANERTDTAWHAALPPNVLPEKSKGEIREATRPAWRAGLV